MGNNIRKKKLKNKVFKNNVILTNSEFLSLKASNLNVLVVGGSGAGKTRYFCLPNLMQMNTSYVVTDPKGEIIKYTGKLFEEAGYKIKVLNLIEMNHSNNYNPFHYILKDEDVSKMINCLIKNTTPVEHKASDSFWVAAEKALLMALSYYLYYEAPEEEQNFSMIMELLRQHKVIEGNEEYKSNLDLLFESLANEKPDHIAVKQYHIFKQAVDKTAKSILISLGVRIAVFNIEAVRRLTLVDNIDFGSIGDEKTILYIIVSDSDDTYNFLVSMAYTQLFNTLLYKADTKYKDSHKGKLPIHVRFILDEFANTCRIPQFDNLVASVRSRGVSVEIIIQNLAQLKNAYKENWETINSNCGSFLFLGSSELSTLEYLSKSLGNQTIDIQSYSRTKGKHGSSSVNYNVKERPLMTPDEIGRIPNDKCLLLVRSMYPFYSDKFKLEKHPEYEKLGYNDENLYDISKIKTYNDEFNFEAKDIVFDEDDIEEIEYEFEHEEAL